MSSLTELFGAIMPIVRASSRASLTGVPLTAVMTSPASIPALAAGLPACGWSTIAPSAFFMPRLSAMPAVTGWICTPSQPRVTWPCSLSWATTIFAVSAGMSKPMPTEPPDGEKIAVLTPITLPSDVERRSAGIALVDRRVDLDVVVIGAGADVAAARRDDAGGHRAAEAERIADRDHPVADARRWSANFT